MKTKMGLRPINLKCDNQKSITGFSMLIINLCICGLFSLENRPTSMIIPRHRLINFNVEDIFYRLSLFM